MVDHWTKSNAVFQAIADLHCLDFCDQLFRKGIIHARLNIDAVGADTGLTVVAEFTNDCAFNSGIQVGVVEHDERRIAAQLHAGLFDLLRALFHQQRAYFG